jgi:hypothetical protein
MTTINPLKSRNIVFYDHANLIWEGSHAILYKCGEDAFGKAMYNTDVLKYSNWTSTPQLYWATYTYGHGAWGEDGLASLVRSAQTISDQASLVHENLSNIGNIVRLVKSGDVNLYVAEIITGFYINEKTGEYVGPNKERGWIVD